LSEAVVAPARPRWFKILPWTFWIAAVLEAALIGFAPLIFPQQLATTPADETIEFAAFLASIALVVMAFATAGLLISRRQPRNAVAWLALVGGPSLGAVFLGYLLGVVLIETDPSAGSWFVLAGVTLFGPALFSVGPGLASVFPTGRPLPGWWTPAFWLSVAFITAGALIVAVAPGPLEESIAVPNPLGIRALPAEFRIVGNALTNLALAATTVVAVASLVVRYLGASSEIRQQLKWFICAGALLAVALPISLVVAESWTAIVALVALGLVPVAVVIAVLRYRLYEIDTLINRTLVYVPLVGIVAGLYAGLVALLQRLFVAFTGNTSDAAAVISALALAAVFTPIRNTIQSSVDRRFKPTTPEPASRWDDPEFRAAVEAIVRDVTGRSG
jgi:two-component system NarL family sensor kinase